MTRNDCLNILELPETATRDDIVTAYRHLVQVWHPDRFANNPDLQAKANAKLSSINEAYEVLTNSNEDSNTADNAQPSNTKTFEPYRDDQVTFLGNDPRVQISSGRRLTSIDLRTNEITLQIDDRNQSHVLMNYPWDSLLAVEVGGVHLIRTNRKIDLALTRTEQSLNFFGDPIPNQNVGHLHFADPEKILTRPFVVTLKFRNDYFAQLFLKRIRLAIDLEEWKLPQVAMPSVSERIANEFLVGFVVLGVGCLLVTMVLLCIGATNRQ